MCFHNAMMFLDKTYCKNEDAKVISHFSKTMRIIDTFKNSQFNSLVVSKKKLIFFERFFYGDFFCLFESHLGNTITPTIRYI